MPIESHLRWAGKDMLAGGAGYDTFGGLDRRQAAQLREPGRADGKRADTLVEYRQQ
ncbi:MAG TPA: hypothetical protein VFP43_06460 [Mesorhizobium sp.]|nr:hypothetical protein [Mesorhizobium sp.]